MIDIALTRRGSAASKPWTIMLAKVLVFAGSLRRARNAAKDMSRSSCAPCTARCASANAFIGRKAPLTSPRCARTDSTAVRPARLSSACVTFASPWMNSAPSSTGIGRPAMRRVQQRPPMRSRASSTSTRSPARASSSAAASPAAPAPMITTSLLNCAKEPRVSTLVAHEAPRLGVEVRLAAGITPGDLQRRRVDLRRFAEE